jgi:hypothetical protein
LRTGSIRRTSCITTTATRTTGSRLRSRACNRARRRSARAFRCTR